jgi:hypothetical protein
MPGFVNREPSVVRSLWLLLMLLPMVGEARVRAHKCTDARGQVSYQQQPCPAGQQARVLEVEGEIDAARLAEAQARNAADAPAARPAAAREAAVAAAPPPVAPPTRKVKCPATQENPGGAPALGTDPMAMAINRDWYSRLPSRTTLKNAGRWPAECN